MGLPGAGAADEAGDDGNEVVGVDGFRDVDLKAGEEGAALVFLVGEGGEGDGGEGAGVEAGGADLADEVVAVFVGHGDVADEDFG